MPALYPRLGMRAALAASALCWCHPWQAALSRCHAGVDSPGAAMLGFALGYLLWFAFALKQTRGFLRRAHRDADATLRSITDGVVITLDREGTIVFQSQAERLFGLGQAELHGKAPHGGVAALHRRSRADLFLTGALRGLRRDVRLA